MKIKSAEFIDSCFKIDQLPSDGLPEFCFSGRSNVGKSSLINMLLDRKNLVKTSKSPGKTISANFFLINKNFYFVDLPGYGYARRSKEMRQLWKKLIEPYLLGRKQLKQLFLLIDSRIGIQDNDSMMLDFLEGNNIPWTPLFTKADKINSSKKKMINNKNDFSIMTSSKTKEGQMELWQCISRNF
ncbi:MAG: ribosome biogenesis GTP-binding protein YihA/YsxC [bacterium]